MPWVTLHVPVHPKTRRTADGTYYSHDGSGLLRVRLHHVAELGRQGGVRPVVPAPPAPPAATVPESPPVLPVPPEVVPPAPPIEASEESELGATVEELPDVRPKRHRAGS